MVTVSTPAERAGRNLPSGFDRLFDGRLRARIQLADGSRKAIIQRKGESLRSLQRRKAEAEAATIRGLPVPERRQTLADFLGRWLSEVVAVSKRPNTVKRYAIDVRRIQESPLGRQKLVDATPQKVQEYLNALSTQQLSPASVRHVRAVLRSALTQAERWGLVARNVARLAEPPRAVKRKVRPPTPEDIDALLQCFTGHSLQNVVCFALMTGLRQGEICGLRWSDIDFDTKTIYIRHQLQRVHGKLQLVEPKSERGRRPLPMLADAADALQREKIRQLEARLLAGGRWQEHGFVFTSSIGTPIPGSTISNRFRWHITASGLPPMRFHDIRHWTATTLLLKRVPAHVVSEFMATATSQPHSASTGMSRSR